MVIKFDLEATKKIIAEYLRQQGHNVLMVKEDWKDIETLRGFAATVSEVSDAN